MTVDTAVAQRPRPRIAVVDHGTGNLTSLVRALERVGAEPVRSSTVQEMADCEGMILPGVGAFPMAMQALDRLELRSLLMDFVVQERPLMGVCLGMQLLFSGSEELGGAEGLGIIDGTVRQLRPGDGKLPHIGWTPVSWTRSSLLNERLPEAAAMYHVHSYVCEPSEPDATLATAVHGETFTTAVSSGSVYGVQFHPEKSSDDGLQLIRNFVAICSGRR